jgi:hypothetical protein
MGTPEKHHIIETNGSGVGLIDYDSDGWLDIFRQRVDGGRDEREGGCAKAGLLHNNHDGTFTDAAVESRRY